MFNYSLFLVIMIITQYIFSANQNSFSMNNAMAELKLTHAILSDQKEDLNKEQIDKLYQSLLEFQDVIKKLNNNDEEANGDIRTLDKKIQKIFLALELIDKGLVYKVHESFINIDQTFINTFKNEATTKMLTTIGLQYNNFLNNENNVEVAPDCLTRAREKILKKCDELILKIRKKIIEQLMIPLFLSYQPLENAYGKKYLEKILVLDKCNEIILALEEYKSPFPIYTLLLLNTKENKDLLKLYDTISDLLFM